MGDERGGDWLTRLGFAVLTGVAEIWDDEVDLFSGRPLKGIDEDENLH